MPCEQRARRARESRDSHRWAYCGRVCMAAKRNRTREAVEELAPRLENSADQKRGIWTGVTCPTYSDDTDCWSRVSPERRTKTKMSTRLRTHLAESNLSPQ